MFKQGKTGRLSKITSALTAAVALVGLVVVSMGISAQHAEAAPATTSSRNLTSVDMGMAITIGERSDPRVDRLLPNYTLSHNRQNKVVSLMKADGSAKAFVQILPAAAHLSTTKAYAQDVMDSYSGWGLTAQIARRGFSFKYVDNAPCAGLLTYFDGTSYLMFGACGVISQDEMAKAFSIAKLQLGLDDITYRSSMPSVYY